MRYPSRKSEILRIQIYYFCLFISRFNQLLFFFHSDVFIFGIHWFSRDGGVSSKQVLSCQLCTDMRLILQCIHSAVKAQTLQQFLFDWKRKLNCSGVTGISKAHFYKIGAFLLQTVFFFWRGGGYKSKLIRMLINEVHIVYQLLCKTQQQQYYFITEYGTRIF